jgi:hypothetical protein
MQQLIYSRGERLGANDHDGAGAIYPNSIVELIEVIQADGFEKYLFSVRTD